MAGEILVLSIHMDIFCKRNREHQGMSEIINQNMTKIRKSSPICIVIYRHAFAHSHLLLTFLFDCLCFTQFKVSISQWFL